MKHFRLPQMAALLGAATALIVAGCQDKPTDPAPAGPQLELLAADADVTGAVGPGVIPDSVVPRHGSHLGPGSIDIVPTSLTTVSNCVPFGSNVGRQFTGFIYRNVPAFTLGTESQFAFDLGALNDVDIQRNIYFATANQNPGTPVLSENNTVSQGIKVNEAGWTQVVSDTQIPLSPRGNTVSGDYELVYTAEASFSFPGGGLIVGFGAAPPSTFVDLGCEQVLVVTVAGDASGFFYARFFSKGDQTLLVLDDITSGGSAIELGGIVIAANTPPVADAGPDQLVLSDGAVVTLDGGNSTDADGTIDTYEWEEGGTPFFGSPSTDPTLVVTLSAGAHTITLTVTDNNGATDSDDVLITVDPEPVIPVGGAATATFNDDDGDAGGGVDIGSGTFPNDEVTVTAELFTVPCHDHAVGQVGSCLDLNLTITGTTDPAESDIPVTIGLCFPTKVVPIDEQDALALIGFEDEQGLVQVLRNVRFPATLNCGDFDVVTLEGNPNPLMRFARGLWRGIQDFFSPQVLMARGDGGFGGRSFLRSFHVWAPQILLRGAVVEVNEGIVGQQFEVYGTLSDAFPAFDEDQDVTVTFGAGPDRFIEKIDAADFTLNSRKRVYQFKAKGKTSGIKHMNIHLDGQFEVSATGVDLTNIFDPTDTDPYVSFTVQIGLFNDPDDLLDLLQTDGFLQGVGIIFTPEGACAGANGSGECVVVKPKI